MLIKSNMFNNNSLIMLILKNFIDFLNKREKLYTYFFFLASRSPHSNFLDLRFILNTLKNDFPS